MDQSETCPCQTTSCRLWCLWCSHIHLQRVGPYLNVVFCLAPLPSPSYERLSTITTWWYMHWLWYRICVSDITSGTQTSTAARGTTARRKWESLEECHGELNKERWSEVTKEKHAIKRWQKDKSVKIEQKGIEWVSVYVPRCSEGIFGVKTLQGKSGKAVKEEYYPLLISIHDCQFHYALRIFCLSQMTIYTHCHLFDLRLNQAGNALNYSYWAWYSHLKCLWSEHLIMLTGVHVSLYLLYRWIVLFCPSWQGNASVSPLNYSISCITCSGRHVIETAVRLTTLSHRGLTTRLWCGGI